MKLDLGCGKNKREGFLGVDRIAFDGIDYVFDIAKLKDGLPEWKILMPPQLGDDFYEPWPWENEEVEEANLSHSFEHLTASQRVHVLNELYRVMKTGAKCTLVTPHESSGRAYGDLTHQWPPVVDFGFYYLDPEWRKTNSPHSNLTCNFLATWGYSIHPAWQSRSQDAQLFALGHYREVAQDLICTITKR
jgi:hypothetical protein